MHQLSDVCEIPRAGLSLENHGGRDNESAGIKLTFIWEEPHWEALKLPRWNRGTLCYTNQDQLPDPHAECGRKWVDACGIQLVFVGELIRCKRQPQTLKLVIVSPFTRCVFCVLLPFFSFWSYLFLLFCNHVFSVSNNTQIIDQYVVASVLMRCKKAETKWTRQTHLTSSSHSISLGLCAALPKLWWRHWKFITQFWCLHTSETGSGSH